MLTITILNIEKWVNQINLGWYSTITRKFYRAGEIFCMFKAFQVINNTPNPYIDEDDNNEAFIETFGGMLNEIGRNVE